TSEASIRAEPSVRTFTRGAVWPRITGRLAPPPKVSELIPGRPVSVSPRVDCRRWTSSSPRSTATLDTTSLLERPRASAVTTTSSKRGAAGPDWGRASAQADVEMAEKLAAASRIDLECMTLPVHEESRYYVIS